jgi:integrase
MAKTKGIYKRGNIYWIRYAGPDGKTRYESSQSTAFKDVQSHLVERRKTVQDGKDPIPTKRIANHSFNELAEYYKRWAERQKAFRSKRGFVNQLVEVFGTCPLRRFTTRHIEEWQTKRLAVNKPATVNRLLTTLKHMFTKAVEWEMVEEESTALNTGMRKEEILSLEWEKHIDLKHVFILLDVTKNGERREIPINRTLRDTLKQVVRHISSPYVFVDANGNRYKDIRRSFKSALRKAGIKDFRFHDLRHCFASHLVMAGVDLTTVKELLGHKTLTMTLRYAHLAPSHKVKAVSILEDALGQRSAQLKAQQL